MDTEQLTLTLVSEFSFTDIFQLLAFGAILFFLKTLIDSV